MSTRVDLAGLAQALADYDYAYLLTVGDEGRTHAVAVTPTLIDGVLGIDEPGRRTAANLAGRRTLTLVFPPRQRDGYSLIIDGDATVGDGPLRVTPTTAVLHRPAPAGSGDSATGCGSDCQRIEAEVSTGATG